MADDVYPGREPVFPGLRGQGMAESLRGQFRAAAGEPNQFSNQPLPRSRQDRSDSRNRNVVSEDEPKPLPPEQKGSRVVMDRELWQMGEDLRGIRWPKVWVDRLATALLGLAVGAALAGAQTWHRNSHSILFGMHYGYFVAASLALLASLGFYAADKGHQDLPLGTVGRVVRKMEQLDWISKPETPPKRTRRERFARKVLRYR